MTIRVVKSRTDHLDAYDAFLTGHPHALIYYSRTYCGFLENHLSCDIEYLLAFEQSQLVGVLPFARAKGKLGDVLNALPFFGSHGGPLCEVENARIPLIEALISEARNSHAALAMFVENPFEASVVPPCPTGWHYFSDTRISQMTPLPEGGTPALHAVIESSARRNVRKAKNNGVTVRIENNQFAFLRDTHIATMTAMGGTPKTPEFFDAIPHNLTADRDYALHVARVEDTPIAALLTLYRYQVAEYFTPVTDPTQKSKEPMAAILSHAMVDASEKGCKLWNWGGTWTDQDGVYRFKKKWGATDAKYHYHILVQNPDILKQTPGELLKLYPNFYTVPFGQLKETANL